MKSVGILMRSTHAHTIFNEQQSKQAPVTYTHTHNGQNIEEDKARKRRSENCDFHGIRHETDKKSIFIGCAKPSELHVKHIVCESKVHVKRVASLMHAKNEIIQYVISCVCAMCVVRGARKAAGVPTKKSDRIKDVYSC